MKLTRKLGAALIITGFSLGYLTWSHSLVALEFLLFPLVSSKFMHYGLLGLGQLLAVIGAGFFVSSFGRGYLMAFLIAGLLVGIPLSFTIYREFCVRSWGMVEIGETTPLTFVYWAVMGAMFYGLIAGTLGTVVYYILRGRS